MIYVDTSALLKRYIAEALSNSFEAFFLSNAPLAISRLTYAEVRSALARRRRAGQIDARIEQSALQQCVTDLHEGALHLYPIEDGHIASAFDLIGRLCELPLRTLDAVHLSVAADLEATAFATADRIQADAAQALGFEVHRFY
ncbi:MAG: type II toxin-antitoxin system VapC family toxin [Rhodocyclaceae bacterium]